MKSTIGLTCHAIGTRSSPRNEPRRAHEKDGKRNTRAPAPGDADKQQPCDEYRDWFGYPDHGGFGRYVALGEYIVELCEIEPHDEWFDAAKDAYLKWKEVHHFTTTPPNLNKH